MNQDGTKRTLFQLLAFPDVSFSDLVPLSGAMEAVDAEAREQLERDALYANYTERQKKDVERLRKDEKYVIPEQFEFSDVIGLSNELRAKLECVRPRDLAQAGRIDGMTPAALALILGRLRYLEKKQA